MAEAAPRRGAQLRGRHRAIHKLSSIHPRGGDRRRGVHPRQVPRRNTSRSRIPAIQATLRAGEGVEPKSSDPPAVEDGEAALDWATGWFRWVLERETSPLARRRRRLPAPTLAVEGRVRAGIHV